MEEFYSMIAALVKTTPNDMELGETVRELVWKIEEHIASEYEEIPEDNQITIFDVIAEEDEEDAIKGYD